MSYPGFVPTKTVRVAHLGGTSVAYHLAKPLKGSKPTLVLIHGLCSNVTQFRAQLDDALLNETTNVLLLDALGHGNTRTKSPSYTLWDSATAFLQAFDALGVKDAIVVGTSMGGWIATRMALYAPERVLGLILIGTCFDSASAGLVERGCAQSTPAFTPIITEMTANPDPNFQIPTPFVENMAPLAFGPNPKPEWIEMWRNIMQSTFTGDDGRLRLQQSVIAAITRDSLHFRVKDLTQPILWIQGTQDETFSVQNAEYELGLTKSVDGQLVTVESGHSPNITHAEETNKYILAFLQKNGGKKDARALREAVGTVDI